MFEKVINCPKCNEPMTFSMSDYYPNNNGWWFTCRHCGAMSIFLRSYRILILGVMLLCLIPPIFFKQNLGRLFWPAEIAALLVSFFAVAWVGRNKASLVSFDPPPWWRRMNNFLGIASIPVAILLVYLIVSRLMHM